MHFWIFLFCLDYSFLSLTQRAAAHLTTWTKAWSSEVGSCVRACEPYEVICQLMRMCMWAVWSDLSAHAYMHVSRVKWFVSSCVRACEPCKVILSRTTYSSLFLLAFFNQDDIAESWMTWQWLNDTTDSATTIWFEKPTKYICWMLRLVTVVFVWRHLFNNRWLCKFKLCTVKICVQFDYAI